jgi:hypothetical protein
MKAYQEEIKQLRDVNNKANNDKVALQVQIESFEAKLTLLQ